MIQSHESPAVVSKVVIKRRWKRSDVTDQMVVAAYADYQRAFDACYGDRPLFELFGLDGAEREPIPYVYDRLVAVLGCPFKVAYSAMERACDRGYIEYGVSLRTGWVTDKGRALFHPAPQGSA